MKTGNDNPQISKIKETNVYPNPVKEKQIYKYATNIFREFTWQEEEDDNRQDTVKELIHLVQRDKTISQFIDLLFKIKHNKNTEKQTKNICSLNQKDKSDVNPLFDLEIEGYHVRQVVLDFRS